MIKNKKDKQSLVFGVAYHLTIYQWKIIKCQRIALVWRIVRVVKFWKKHWAHLLIQVYKNL